MLLGKNNLSLAVTSERALPLPAGRAERDLAGYRQGEGEPGYWCSGVRQGLDLEV
jgi:hypothetical protein